MEPPKIDITGKRYGKLIAVRYAGKDKRFNSMWECLCDCGGSKIVKYGHLNSGHVISCGCRHKEALVERNKTHGETYTKLYERYHGMLGRCNCESNNNYKNYGARGIKVCDEWNRSFVSFKNWALANGYNQRLVIDRIDSDKGYSPENCRWVTRTVNNQNARPHKGVAFRGVRKSANKFSSYICADKKYTFLGMALTAEEAAATRNEYIKKHGLSHRLANLITAIKGA